MTTDELAKLTPEEKRIKIAEACGKKPWRGLYARRVGLWFSIEFDGKSTTFPVPDYLNDLNDCHEMEKTLDDDHYWGKGELKGFCEWLMDIVPCRSQSATAAQRADAFLLTVG